MQKLTIVFTVLGQHEMATLAIKSALDCIGGDETNIVIIDNGGDYEFPYESPRVTIERNLEFTKPVHVINMGVYPVFKYAFNLPTVDGEIVAFFHSDLIVTEHNFDRRILDEFAAHPKLGLMGFVGSNEIDAAGGRGGGTTSNFQGQTYRDDRDIMDGQTQWTGSPAEHHGKRNSGYTNAAVVDGCAMIIRRAAWEDIGYRGGFPPHHFYDRLISTQMLEKRWQVAVLGIACDHLSGQTVSKEDRYANMAEEWCEVHLSPNQYVGTPPNYSWDQTVYQEAERLWLSEYRDEKHLVPIRV